MSAFSVLLLGVGLGLRHATDADHVVVVATLLQREPGARRAARIAALWGAGHTATFLGLGLLIVLMGLRVPPHFEKVAELHVAVMLLGVGAWHLWRSFAKESPAAEQVVALTYARPVLVGLIHGLAGSAGIALLVSTTIDSRVFAVVYLGLFGLGTVAGMVLLTVVLSWPITWSIRRDGLSRRIAAAAAALLSLALGATFIREALARGGAA